MVSPHTPKDLDEIHSSLYVAAQLLKALPPFSSLPFNC